MLCKMVIFQEEKIRIWPIADQPVRQVTQTKAIQKDFTKFAVTFEPKVQITLNKNLVKAIVNIYYVIVNNQTFMAVSQKKKS